MESQPVKIKGTNRVDLIIKQLLVGAVCGVMGFVLFAFFGQYIFGRLDLFGSIMYAIVSGYLTMYFGIAIYSYIQLRQLLTINQILKVYYFTFPAFLATLYSFIFPISEWSWHIACLTFLYSIVGIIWGFNRTVNTNKPT